MEPKKKRTPSQNGKRSRRKGHAAERELRDMLRPLFPGCDRNLSQVRSGQKEGADLLGTPGFHFESKCGARPDPWKALAQAESDLLGLRDNWSVPVAAIKRDRCHWMACLRFHDFVFLLEKLKRLEAT